ncbi:alpha/beta fold hydrolase [Salegentibacter sp. F188]|uniref:Alpha/beta fold hydrolase n=1 Tax=Autumnicola patrickiae TaxID=3075591 RepID=A0ABU3E7A8_9FLAO|nr:alpha/beta fold hydrolase [Salegentibacter sp. F188]MDT0691882.1 alpha/beta fold hydrolase [Salegentibacter sp. F188]
MPILKSTYKAPFLFRSAHFSTIYASLLRKVNISVSERERVEISDGDFLDLDWRYAKNGNYRQLMIVTHGLAGSADRPYMLGMAKAFSEKGFDVALINFRSCSGEINRLFRSYNAGATEDLREVIDFCLQKKKYDKIVLSGFSLGGNLLLKYLGETENLPKEIKAAVAVSVPSDLGASLRELDKHKNFLYSRRFLKKLKNQLYERQKLFPKKIDRNDIAACNSLLAIDELYTSKAHGYKSAADYYKKCSSLQFLSNIGIPTLLINAKNDSFLSKSSYPVEIAKNSKFLYLEVPKHGGHVGFFQKGELYYHEERAVDFCCNF